MLHRLGRRAAARRRSSSAEPQTLARVDREIQNELASLGAQLDQLQDLKRQVMLRLTEAASRSFGPDSNAMLTVEREPAAGTVPGMSIGRTLYWNGKDLPDELRALPAGTYAVEPADQVPLLTEDDEAGLEAALDSLQAGKGRTLAQVPEAIAARLAAAR